MDDASLSGEPDGRQGLQDDLGQIVEQLMPRAWTSPAATPEPLAGGITNRNYRATFGGTDYVIRVPGKDTSLLGDRPQRRVRRQRAPRPRSASPRRSRRCSTDPPAIVTDFIEGRAMEPAELREPAAALRRRGRAARDARGAGASPSRFDSFRIVEDYERVARDLGVRRPGRVRRRARARGQDRGGR